MEELNTKQEDDLLEMDREKDYSEKSEAELERDRARMEAMREIKMNEELKTLKDMFQCNLQCGYDHLVKTSDLKAEAIKWAKIMQNIDNKEMRLEFFLKIFNITEGDLK